MLNSRTFGRFPLTFQQHKSSMSVRKSSTRVGGLQSKAAESSSGVPNPVCSDGG